MKVVAWALVVLNAVIVVGGPFMIGATRESRYTASWYVSILLGAALDGALAGRVLGWW